MGRKDKNIIKGKGPGLPSRGLKGSATIEMAYMFPAALAAFFLILYTVFYYHDKVIINAAACEAAAVGASYARQHMGDEEELIKFYKGRVSGKLILLRVDYVDVEIKDGAARASAKASFKGMSVSADCRAHITGPEKKIRAKRLLTD